MNIEERVLALRRARLKARGLSVASALSGVTMARVERVLAQLGFADSPNMACVVYALLDDETPSWYTTAPSGALLRDGASTAHIGSHVGILQRGGKKKLDREGRDYWIKPLRELGAIRAVTLQSGGFVPGHVKAKSAKESSGNN